MVGLDSTPRAFPSRAVIPDVDQECRCIGSLTADPTAVLSLFVAKLLSVIDSERAHARTLVPRLLFPLYESGSTLYLMG